MSINYVKGDATAPIGEGHKIIVHCCNNSGYWGAGFVLAVSARWPQVRRRYQELSRRYHNNLPLGICQFVKLSSDLHIANVIGQQGIRSQFNPEPIKYWAIRQGLKEVAEVAKENNNASIHMPRMGAGLAGGDWNRIEEIINETLIGLDVTVYSL